MTALLPPAQNVAAHPAPDAHSAKWARWAAAALGGLCASALLMAAPAEPAPDTAPAALLTRLPAVATAPGGITVSGLSSGGYMAGQFQVAFSSLVSGAAVLAAGPYGCSRGSLATAMFQCSCPPQAASLPGSACSVLGPGVLASFSDGVLAANRPDLDDPAHLASHRVWLMSGGHDEVVRPALVDAAQAFYRRHGVPAAAIHHERITQAGHGMPAPDGPVACGTTASPYVTHCKGQDAAGELLQWLLARAPGAPAWHAAVAPRPAGLRRFSQQPYRQPGVFDGLDSSGWLYVPAACEAGGAACRLHVVFHGCAQAQGFVGPDGQAFGTRFIAEAGYARWAEANHIVLLYPQVAPTQAARLGSTWQLNPQACWDFWGYTQDAAAWAGQPLRFAQRSGPQLRAVRAMVADLQGR